MKTLFLLFCLLCFACDTKEDIPTFKQVLAENGTPLALENAAFPFGFFTVYNQGQPLTQKLKDLRTISDAGFTLVHTDLFRADSAYFDSAFAQGVDVIFQISGEDFSFYPIYIENFKNKPALLGYDIADDFNYDGNCNKVRFSPEQMRQRHEFIKKHDQEHLTYASGIGDPRCLLEEYNGTVDIFGNESYPIANEETYDKWLNYHTDYMNAVSEAFTPNQTTHFLLLQTFAWEKQYPTAIETRNMLYNGLIKGAKGIMAYTFYDDDGYLDSLAPELWQELQVLNKEVALLQNVYLKGNRSLLNNTIPSPHIHSAYWNYQGQSYLVVLSTSRTTAIPIKIPLANQGTLNPLFADRPQGLTLENGFIQGTVDTAAVHVYEIISQ